MDCISTWIQSDVDDFLEPSSEAAEEEKLRQKELRQKEVSQMMDDMETDDTKVQLTDTDMEDGMKQQDEGDSEINNK